MSRQSSCGGLVELVKAGFETLTEAGYPRSWPTSGVLPRDEDDRRPHVRKGIHFMNYSISNTAEYGEYYAGPWSSTTSRARP